MLRTKSAPVLALLVLAAFHAPLRGQDEPTPYGEAKGESGVQTPEEFDAARRAAKEATKFAASPDSAPARAVKSADDPIDPRDAPLVGVFIAGARPSAVEVELLARLSACWIKGERYTGPFPRLVPAERLEDAVSVSLADSSGMCAWTFGVHRSVAAGARPTPLAGGGAQRLIRFERWTIASWDNPEPGSKVPPKGQALFAFGASESADFARRKLVRHLSDGTPVVIGRDVTAARQYRLNDYFHSVMDDDLGPKITVFLEPELSFARAEGDLDLLARAISGAGSPEEELSALVEAYRSNPEAHWTGCRAAVLAELLARTGSVAGNEATAEIAAVAVGPVADFVDAMKNPGLTNRTDRVTGFVAAHPGDPALSQWLQSVLAALESDSPVALIPLAGEFVE